MNPVDIFNHLTTCIKAIMHDKLCKDYQRTNRTCIMYYCDFDGR